MTDTSPALPDFPNLRAIKEGGPPPPPAAAEAPAPTPGPPRSSSGAVHWNHNLICAVDVETTGTDPQKHEIIQIALVPLAPDLTPRKDVLPFYTEIAPMHPEWADPEAMRVCKLDVDKLLETAMDQWRVADLFEEWFERLNLPWRKQILPLAHNFPFEAGFLRAWLGSLSYEHFFFGYRDTMTIANMLNDIADMNNEPRPFPKVSLTYLCSQLMVENRNPHDALGDAVATAECYKKLVTRYRIY
jgi:DNA polymerase III epsilon subunit-like protein